MHHFGLAIGTEKAESSHAVARRILGELFLQRSQFVTTLPVLCEIHAYFARAQKKRELVLNDLCNNPVVAIEEISPQDQKTAMELLRRHRDKEYSLCDALFVCGHATSPNEAGAVV